MESKKTNIDKLLEISSDSLDINVFDNNSEYFLSNYKDLLPLYINKNGFLAFESALEIFPIHSKVGINVMFWNNPKTWKEKYNSEISDLLCFGQDVFGNQFYFSTKLGFGLLNTETLETEYMASNIDEWAKILLEKYDYYTGYSIAVDWQKSNFKIKTGDRLTPKVPFFLGGDYNKNNLISENLLKILDFRAEIYNQTKDLKDGERVSIKVSN